MTPIRCVLVLSLLGGLLSAPARGQSADGTVDATVGPYRIRIHRLEDDGPFRSYLRVERDGELVEERTGHRLRLGPLYPDWQPERLAAPGTDITGDGRPNVVVSEWTGGAHCCLRVHVYEVGDAFRHLHTIEARHSDATWFEDPDGDGVLEFVTADWTFAYWRACFAGSPAPEVVLTWDPEEGRYAVAPEHMLEEAPSPTELATRARRIRETDELWRSDRPTSVLWGAMLDLIYTGHADLVPSFLEQAWRPDTPGLERFREAFEAQLAESPYRDGIRALNEGAR